MGTMTKRLYITALYCTYAIIAFCQTSFTMAQHQGDYFITTVVNGKDSACIFVESGVPGLLVNEKSYKRLFGNCSYEKVEPKCSEVRGFSVNHNVIRVLRGKVLIGDLSYQGNIYVIDNYEKVAVPVHLLKNEKDSTKNMIRLNFKNKTLDFVGNEIANVDKMNKYKMIDFNPMPVIEATLSLSDAYGNGGLISGKFIFDLGNSSPLYVTTANPRMAKFIKTNKYRLSPVKDRSTGKQVGYGIFAVHCLVGKNKLRDVSIGMTNKISIGDVLGFVGPSLFNKGYVIVDPKNNYIYYE